MRSARRACVLIALRVDSALALTLALGVAGAGNAIASPTASGLLHRHVEPRRHGLAFSAQQSGGALTALLTGLALPVIALPLGWRWAFILAAVLSVALAAFTPAVAAVTDAPREHRDCSGAPASRSVLGLAVTAALANTAAIGFISSLVLYSTRRGLSEGEAGTLLACQRRRDPVADGPGDSRGQKPE